MAGIIFISFLHFSFFFLSKFIFQSGEKNIQIFKFIQIHPNSSKFIQKKEKCHFCSHHLILACGCCPFSYPVTWRLNLHTRIPKSGWGWGWWCRAGALDGATVELPSNRSNLIDSRSRRHRSVSDRRINRYFIIIKFISLPSPPSLISERFGH